MSVRELVVLGTACQVPTRERNHNGYLLRWDGEGFLFDPGEGTQRQMLLAGVAANDVTRLCVSHFHGDHCLGVPGVLQRRSADDLTAPLTVHYPASGRDVFARLRQASLHVERAEIHESPVERDGVVATGPWGRLEARALEHRVDAYGYRLVEPDGRRVLPDRLAAVGVTGPDVGELQREGRIAVGGRTVTLDEVSEPRRGQRFAFVMDTRLCDAVHELAAGADLLVSESTFVDADAHLAQEYRHLTAGQAARVAQQAGVRTLVLTHFSQRYPDPAVFEQEARAHFDGEVVVARDLQRVPVPRR